MTPFLQWYLKALENLAYVIFSRPCRFPHISANLFASWILNSNVSLLVQLMICSVSSKSRSRNKKYHKYNLHSFWSFSDSSSGSSAISSSIITAVSSDCFCWQTVVTMSGLFDMISSPNSNSKQKKVKCLLKIYRNLCFFGGTLWKRSSFKLKNIYLYIK